MSQRTVLLNRVGWGACVLAASWLVGGCGGSPADPNGSDEPGEVTVLLPAADASTLEDQAAGYIAERRTMSSTEAREALVARLLADANVHYAELSADGSTVWVKFKSGYVSAINTVEGFGNGAAYDMAPMQAEFESAMQAKARGLAARRSTARVAATLPCTFPTSRKILLMSPGAEEFDGQDVALFEYIKDYLVQHRGWSADDIVIKYNRAEDEYATLRPEDFFDLDQYGVVIICAHAITRETVDADADDDADDDDVVTPGGPGTSDPFNFGFRALSDHYYYIQVASTAGGPSVLAGSDPYHFGFRVRDSIDWEAELASGRILAVNRVDVFKQTSRAYLYMREDLWSEHLGPLPDSFVYLVTCNGSFDAATDPAGSDPFNFGFRRIARSNTTAKAIEVFDSGLGSFMAWDGVVSTHAALDAVWIIPWMALNSSSDVEEYSRGIMPMSSVTVDPDPDPSSTSGDPFGFGFRRISSGTTWSCSLDLCPYTLGMTRYLYLPSWASVATVGAPSSAVSVRVEVAYDNPDLPAPDPNVVEDVPHVGKNFEGLISGGTATFTATALDSAGNALDEAERTVTFSAGANTVVVRFKDYGIILESDRDAIEADGVDAAIITATLKQYTDTDVVVPTGDPVADKSVIFATTHGELVGPNPVDTDAAGVATVVLVGDSDGIAAVKAVAPADDVESDEVIVRIGEPEYNVTAEADPPVVVFDPGTTAEITITATARYCTTPGEYPPTGDPVVGKEFDWSTSWHYAEMIGANPGTTDANGQISITLRTDKEGGGDMLAFNAADAKGGNAYYQFKWTDPEWYPASIYGEITTDPDAGFAGWAVYLVFDKVDPAPAEYKIFGWGFNDTAYYGHSLSADGPPFPKGRETATQWYVFLTGGGGSWNPNSGTAEVEETLNWGLGRFAGGTFMVTAVP